MELGGQAQAQLPTESRTVIGSTSIARSQAQRLPDTQAASPACNCYSTQKKRAARHLAKQA